MPVTPLLVAYPPLVNAYIRQYAANLIQGSATSYSVALSQNTLPGSTILLFATCDNSTGNTITSFSDPVNGTYTFLNSYLDGGNDDFRNAYYPNANSVPSTSPFTVSLSGITNYPGLLIVEVAGVTTNPLMANAVHWQGSLAAGTNNITSGNVSVIGPSIIIGFTNNDENGSQATPGSGFTIVGDVWPTQGGCVEYQKSINPGGNIAATFSSTGSDTWVSWIVALQSL